jgi:hypothetical protein
MRLSKCSVFMLSVAYKALVLSVIILNVVLVSVKVPGKGGVC